MTEQGLKIIQGEYDLKKYNQSTIARVDMSGKMEYCKGCLFRTELPSCVLDHETRVRFSVCARNGVRLEEDKNANKTNKTNGTGKTRRKSSNV
jgi:hypothetical protein